MDKNEAVQLPLEANTLITSIIFVHMLKNRVSEWEGFNRSIEEGVAQAEDMLNLPRGALQLNWKTFDNLFQNDNNTNKNLN